MSPGGAAACTEPHCYVHKEKSNIMTFTKPPPGKSHMTQTKDKASTSMRLTVISGRAFLYTSLTHSSVNTEQHVIFLPINVFSDYVLQCGMASVCVCVCYRAILLITPFFICDHTLPSEKPLDAVYFCSRRKKNKKKTVLGAFHSTWDANWMRCVGLWAEHVIHRCDTERRHVAPCARSASATVLKDRRRKSWIWKCCLIFETA